MDWFERAIIYHIFIDRFAGYDPSKDWNKPEFMGGNLKGIIDKISYLNELGVTAIWLSPFYETSEYHGYAITDYTKVDKRFGTEEDLKQLIKKCHARGIKVIADMVPNHVSNKHPVFVEAHRGEEHPYRDWFYFRPDNSYMGFFNLASLPKLNVDNPAVFNHLVESHMKWLSMGLDGFRLDHVIGLSDRNVKRLVDTFRESYPETIYFGEAWMNGVDHKILKTIKTRRKHRINMLGSRGTEILYANYRGILDGMLDFKTMGLIEEYEHTGHDSLLRQARKSILRRKPLQSVTFLDNHDVQRFLARMHGDTNKLKNAATVQFALGQPSVIYYGTEVGLSNYQMPSFGTPHADLYARQPMIWDKHSQNQDLLGFYKWLIQEHL